MTDRELDVRRYEPRDRDDVWRVHDRALRDSEMAYDPEYNRYLRHVEHEFLDAGGEFLVGTVAPEGHGDDGPLVAIGGYQPLPVLAEDYDELGYTPREPAFDDSVRIRSVAVLPAHQGTGVGTALTRELERRAAEHGFEQAFLETPRTLSAARAFWTGRGYEQVDAVGEYAVYRKRF